MESGYGDGKATSNRMTKWAIPLAPFPLAAVRVEQR
jgi:hypothetical protein